MEPVKVFLDTNIVLDYFTGRIGNDNAKTIVLSGLDPRIDLCISILTAMNVLYVSGKYTLSLRPSDISELFSILPMDSLQYDEAQSLSLKDFEDSLQIVCARNNGCWAIISRDKHILEFGIRFPVILSPEEYLRKIAL